MPRSHIQRKHLRIDLSRADRLVPHQRLQLLEWNTGIQHMHRVAVSESVRGDGDRERHTILRCRSVSDCPQAYFLHATVFGIPAFQWNFQRGHHGLQLRDVLRIRLRHQAVCRAASLRFARPSSARSLSVANCANG